jgi:hypothetical protein
MGGDLLCAQSTSSNVLGVQYRNPERCLAPLALLPAAATGADPSASEGKRITNTEEKPGKIHHIQPILLLPKERPVGSVEAVISPGGFTSGCGAAGSARARCGCPIWLFA